jgi:succinyl-CoA synthetase beta subunit
VLFGRGIESVFHAADALDRFVAGPLATLASAGDDEGDEPAPGAAPELIATAAGPMVPFASAMALLTSAGIPVAPWEAVAPDAPAADVARVALRVGSRLVVKLANVAHRTELDAVRVDVAVEEAEHAIAELRAIAGAHQVDATVAIQAMVSGHAEAFAGVHCGTGLGDVLLFGRGGVLVELADAVTGRFLPVDARRADELAREVAGPEVIAGLRGQRPWPLASAAEVICGLDRLWRTHSHWMSSLDVNPLIVTDDGLVAVDALFLADRPRDVI